VLAYSLGIIYALELEDMSRLGELVTSIVDKSCIFYIGYKYGHKTAMQYRLSVLDRMSTEQSRWSPKGGLDMSDKTAPFAGGFSTRTWLRAGSFQCQSSISYPPAPMDSQRSLDSLDMTV
jgi:hypothetical protein